MDGQTIVERVQQLDLSADSYVVFGRAPLVLAGLRESEDIDILATPELMDALEARGWQRVDAYPGVRNVAYDVFDAYDTWQFGDYNPSVAELLATATIVDGVPFASLAEVRAWKVAFGREKDAEDVKRIDEYLLPP